MDGWMSLSAIFFFSFLFFCSPCFFRLFVPFVSRGLGGGGKKKTRNHLPPRPIDEWMDGRLIDRSIDLPVHPLRFFSLLPP